MSRVLGVGNRMSRKKKRANPKGGGLGTVTAEIEPYINFTL